MSQAILTNGGQNIFTDTIRTAALIPPTGHTAVKLFQNNIVPQFNTNAGDFTEADFAGYVAVDLDSWTLGLNEEGFWEAFPATTPATYTAGSLTGPQTIYGYYVLYTNGTLMFAERFDTPIIVQTTGQVIFAFPRVSIQAIVGTGNIND